MRECTLLPQNLCVIRMIFMDSHTILCEWEHCPFAQRESHIHWHKHCQNNSSGVINDKKEMSHGMRKSVLGVSTSSNIN